MAMSSDLKFRGGLVIISGPSGVGKSTICSGLVERLDDVYLSISTTTRGKGVTEEDGREYFFISKEEFFRRIKQGKFLEYAEVFGNYYGTPKGKIEEALSAGKVVILEIDIQGGTQAKRLYPEAVMIFILPPDHDKLSERMSNRGRGEDDESARARLEGAGMEIASAFKSYDHMVINDNLDEAIEEVLEIINKSFGDK